MINAIFSKVQDPMPFWAMGHRSSLARSGVIDGKCHRWPPGQVMRLRDVDNQ